MSYDMSFVCDRCRRSGEVEINLTYNLQPMLAEAGLPTLFDYNGKPALEVASDLLRLLDKMEEDPDRYRALNPSNGWGTYDGCLQGRLREWAEQVNKTALDTDLVEVF